MPGIYLLVKQDEESKNEANADLLQGRPHLTLAYTGDQLSQETLAIRCTRAASILLARTVTLDRAKLDVFVHDKTKKKRVNILLMASEIDTKLIATMRRDMFSSEEAVKITTREPHVTAATFNSEEEAQVGLMFMQAMLPLKVTITGVCFRL